MRVGDMAFLPRERRFAIMLNRFDWAGAGNRRNSGKGHYQRRRSALRFEKVGGAQYQRLMPGNQDQTVELLALKFETADPPGGYITLLFAGGAAIRLEVECIEAELRDLGPVWKTKHKPEHPGDDPASV